MATLTYEELAKLPMQYIFGLSGDEYCARKYVNEEWNIAKEVITDRVIPGDIYSGFKKPKVGFYRGAGKVYDSPRKFWEGEFLTPWFTYEHGSQKDWLPVRPGWYETKWRRSQLGMTWWSGQCWYTDETMNRLVAVTAWRGMRDITTLTKEQA